MVPRRVALSLAAAVAVFSVAWNAGSASAVDCVGPDDPPGCVTPSPTPSPTPTPTPTAGPLVIVVSPEQYEPVVWGLGVIACVSIVGVVGAWSR